MRGIFIVGLLIVALIGGLLVMKNMGADNSSGVTKTQAQKYIKKAESATDDVNKRLKDFNRQVKDTTAD